MFFYDVFFMFLGKRGPVVEAGQSVASCGKESEAGTELVFQVEASLQRIEAAGNESVFVAAAFDVLVA